jgi:hypothetical protein
MPRQALAHPCHATSLPPHAHGVGLWVRGWSALPCASSRHDSHALDGEAAYLWRKGSLKTNHCIDEPITDLGPPVLIAIAAAVDAPADAAGLLPLE